MIGKCKCGCYLWEWELKEHELILICSRCERKAKWTVMFPMIDLLNQVKEDKDDSKKKLSKSS